MDFERSYDSAIEFLYENKNKSMFRPKPYAVSYSIRSREFRVVGFYKEFTPTLNARDYKDPKCVIVPVKHKTVERRIVAMRGRNPNNPSERARSDGNYVQRFEFNAKGLCNTLTTVDKDNYVLEVING